MTEEHLEISPSALSLEAIVARVRADAAGAISTFVGVTRDTFEGKKVSTLEYEVRPIHWFPYDRVGVVNADP
ncbi:molybdopterin synthase [Micromonas pusilla CCMP1545]|jgi:molybdopterin synthase catalytic subunit|uniref:Molybdopterin synthase n=1 Tax=Micromonas pusilla (strain CCMP1545) TaxID=564608 RepID=C1N7M7_MICPC|nr:molybdopterin synthase [Micromonas pusilla CCMP1545]EEH51553.1 molybdopterin synthase [Micromonas pusilla CCMP1545]|eukprot:XP_003063931.1 molybdopterin synthase [Micromonas pusilla CCMP1545]